LNTFQNEWDAIAIETFELKKQLAQTRQELSTALYDYEGALRLLALVTKERDDARGALARVQVGTGAQNGGSMEVDAVGLSDDLLETIDETQQKLSASRRKRPVPKGWSSGADIQSFEATPSEGFKSSKELGSASALAESQETEESSSRILYGSENGTALVYETDGSVPPFELNTGSRILDGTFWGSKAVFALASGAVKIYDGSTEHALFAVHAGPATGVSLHPSGDLLASVGSDKSYVLYDLRSLDRHPAARVFTDSGKLHLLFTFIFNY
jgi:pre-mRNA-processing factor 19